jgi:hypothetical protein
MLNSTQAGEIQVRRTTAWRENWRAAVGLERPDCKAAPFGGPRESDTDH